MVPRFPYQFPQRQIEAYPGFLLEHNRCVQCQRCVRAIQTEDGRKIFAMKNRSKDVRVNVDPKLAAKLSPDQIQKAMDICPVGAILKKKLASSARLARENMTASQLGVKLKGKSEVSR